MTRSKDSIVDATVPSAGRIYDFILGGHHNFEVDRQAAQFILANLPYVTKMMRLQRWCLQDIARELTDQRGFDVVVDFASGLPTQDHIHQVVPKGTTVIYSDYDPIVVEYAREILGHTPDVYFFEADARQPDELLQRPEVEAILAGRRDLAIVYWGVGAFLSDEDLRSAARKLYDWTGPNSCWAFNAQAADANMSHPMVPVITAMYQRIGAPLYLRTKQSYLDLVRPWTPDGEGLVSLLEWHGFDSSELSEEDIEAFGAAGAGYGGYLSK
jgi:hypothetical protein